MELHVGNFHNHKVPCSCLYYFRFCISAGDGSEDEPCFNMYHGPHPFSEPEIKGVADFLTTIKNLKGFIDFHSYGQLWMAPWGYKEDLPDDFEEQV